MNEFVCLDTSVLVKLLTYEEGSATAHELMAEIVDAGQKVLLPDFGWAEVASVLRKKVLWGLITEEQAQEAWRLFGELGIIHYIGGIDIRDRSWEIATAERLPTIYDAAFLAVCEMVSDVSNEACVFWTADKALAQGLGKQKTYIRLL